MNCSAFLEGFLEKMAESYRGFSSKTKADRHAKKHAPNLGISSEEYLQTAEDLLKDRLMWTRVEGSGNPTYRHKIKGWTAVLTQDQSKVKTIY